MEIKVGAKFNKVGTEEIVTVTKYDKERGTVIVKFSSGRSIPMSTGSLMKENKWAYIDDEQEDAVVEEKPKKAKKEKVKKEKKEKVVKEKSRKPLVKMSKTKVKEEVTNILLNFIKGCNNYEMFMCISVEDKSRKENKIEWSVDSAKSVSKISIIYYTKEKKFEVFFDDEIADLIKDTEFSKLGEITDEFIEDKLKTFSNIIVERLNEKTESEEKTDGTI